MQRAEYRLAHLDSLRFLASALVVFQHLFEHRGGFIGAEIIPLGPGVAGVALFFFISGFVIPFSVGESLDLRRFMVRRLFRIYPLFIAALAVLVLGAATGLLSKWNWMLTAPSETWFANVFLVQDFVGQRAFLGVTWTLAIELIWYMAFAVSLVWFGSRAPDILDIVVPASLVVLMVVSLTIDTRIPLGRPTMVYAAVIGYQTYRFVTEQTSLRKFLRSMTVFAGVATASTVIAFGYFEHPEISFAQAMGPWTLGTTLFLIGVLWRKVRDGRWMVGGLFPWLGAMSYSTYLFHPIANAIAFSHFDQGQYWIALVLTFLASVVGYYAVERPGITMGKRVANWFPKAPARPVVAERSVLQ